MKDTNELRIPVMKDMAASGKMPEYLLWIGCAGSFDDRYKKVIASLIRILNLAEINFAVLGPEESCTGDPARRAGNEFLFQMQALSNIQLLNNYKVKKILTSCPHCFHTFKNEYPALGGRYEVIHHTQFLDSLIDSGFFENELKEIQKAGSITYHDSCYLGRSNAIYDEPRNIIRKLKSDLIEMERHKKDGLCCGAGGAQMFKEAEKGNKEVNIERSEEALGTGAGTIATGCPFCLTMMTDGIKELDQEGRTEVLDVVEILERSIQKKKNPED